MIDLRSDTVTKPTKGMLDAMMIAPVGDDVFNEDPTIHALERRVADIFGFEAGLFCPSGTMTNQIAIKVHTQPLEEIICHRLSHIYNYEGGGIAFNSALSMRLLEGKRGFISSEDVVANINETEDVHKPITSLVSQENTCNKAGGAAFKVADYQQVYHTCKQHGLRHHLDGARLFNALAVTGDDAKAYSKAFDSISICLSKGLGAPVGSVLIGDKDFIKQARRVRKVLGGGMRQAGVIAAAGLYALDNHVERLREDHAHAQQIKETLETCGFVEDIYPVETNIVIFKVKDELPAEQLHLQLQSKGILAINMGPQLVRFVTHLDASAQDIDQVCATLRSI